MAMTVSHSTPLHVGLNVLMSYSMHVEPGPNSHVTCFPHNNIVLAQGDISVSNCKTHETQMRLLIQTHIPSLSVRFFSSFSQLRLCALYDDCRFSICLSRGLVAAATLCVRSSLRLSEFSNLYSRSWFSCRSRSSRLWCSFSNLLRVSCISSICRETQKDIFPLQKRNSLNILAKNSKSIE